MAAKGHGNEHKAELEHIAVLNVRRPPSNPLVRVISSCLKHLGEGQRGGWCRCWNKVYSSYVYDGQNVTDLLKEEGGKEAA